MTVTGIISWLVIGGVVGGLGRLVVPGRQPIPIWLMVLVGTIASSVGSFLAVALGLSPTSGIDWLELLFQVVLAAIGVTPAANLYARRGRRSFGYTSSSGRTPLPADWTPGPPSRSRGANGAAGAELGGTPSGTAAAQDFRRRQPAASTAQSERVGSTPVSPAPPPRPPSRVFVSYRRADTWPVARLMVDRLRTDFTHHEVFMDVGTRRSGGQRPVGDRVRIGPEQGGHARPGERCRDAAHRAGARPSRPLLRLNALHVRHLSWDRDIEELVRDVRRRRP